MSNGILIYRAPMIQDRRMGKAAASMALEELRNARDNKGEAELESYNTYLDEIVILRTEKLCKAKEAAEAANTAKSAFLANVSHEIRTPLNAVLGFSQIGLCDCKDGQAANLFRKINDAGGHLLSVINDILDFSKIEAGKLSIKKQPFALLLLIENAKSFVALIAAEKGLTLSISLAPGLPEWVEGDALRVTQILTNLLSNAVKFTSHGEVILRVERDGDFTSFTVTDSGIGISEAQMDRLFQPFEQIDNSIAHPYGGTGLGLAISQKLAHMMGGGISVGSQLGKGSSFCLCLPLAPAHAQPVQQVAAAPAWQRLKGVSVLVAEDGEANCLIIEDMLTREGAHAILAKDGQEAFDLLNEKGEKAFDVVLMDIQMPVMDGYETTRCIAQVAPFLPVIGLTAHAMAEERDKCLAAGMVEYLTKPVDSETLISAIYRHWSPQNSPAAMIQATAVTKVIKPSMFMFTACNDPSVIDLDILAQHAGNEPAKVARLAAAFSDITSDDMAEMHAALEAGDLPALARIGHRIGSAAQFVGAMHFSKLCKELESFEAGGEIDMVREKVDQLHLLFEQIKQRTEKIIHT